MSALVAEKFDYDPFSTEAMTDPRGFYSDLRDHFPAFYMPRYDAWAISRFADVWDGFLDSKNFSEVEGQIISREQLLVHHQGAPAAAPLDPVMAAFPVLDGRVHTRLRQVMAPALLKPAVNRMAPMLTSITKGRLEELAGRDSFDLNEDLGSHVSCSAVAMLCGLDPQDLPQIIALVNAAVAREPGQPGFTDAGMQALGDLVGRLMAATARRRSGGGEPSMIDPLLSSEVNGRLLSDQEIASNLVSIIIGGTETVPKILAGGLLQLARRPAQMAEIVADPDSNALCAVEEMLRYNAPAQWFARTATNESELAGVPVKAGQRVILLVASANRDPREFGDTADQFIWNRKARRVISFGIGPHFCIGIHLARLELQVMVREVAKIMPRLEIDEAGGKWPVSEFQIGWTRLPARITT